LLNVIVGFERPDKEKQRIELVQNMSDNRKKLKTAEDQLLQALSESKGKI
jgi:dynein heavy chain